MAGEAVRVSGLGTFDVAARPAREGRNPQTGEAIKILARKAVRFHAGKAVKDALNPPPPRRAPQERTAPPSGTSLRASKEAGVGAQSGAVDRCAARPDEQVLSLEER